MSVRTFILVLLVIMSIAGAWWMWQRRSIPLLQEAIAPMQLNDFPLEEMEEGVVVVKKQVEGEIIPPPQMTSLQETDSQSVLQWAYAFRTILADIRKLYSIENGDSILPEGEVPPDLHAAYVLLHEDRDTLEADQEILSLVGDMDDELGAMIHALSAPPLLAELVKAKEDRELLRTKIDVLYDVLENRR